jgi:hypothetical protein
MRANFLGKPRRVVPYTLKKIHSNWRCIAGQNNTSVVFSAVMDGEMQVVKTKTTLDP